jgi:hypothetical protein
LASLLNGSHFNYILLGSATDPSALDRVMLMSKSGGDESAPQPIAAGPQYSAPVAAVSQPPENADDDSADMSQDSTDTDDQAGQSEEQPQQQPSPAAPAGNVRTPEQLLQELQQRQQQIQQQQQQQGIPQSFPPTPLGIPQPPRPQP